MKIIKLVFIFCFIFCTVNSNKIFGTHASGLDLTYTCSPGGNILVGNGNVVITITTGTFGYEQSWDITDSNGNIVGQGGQGGVYASNDSYTIVLCLPAGSYTFNAYDTFGDGWNGGTYSVVSNNINLTSQGNNFITGTLFTENMNVSNVPCDDIYQLQGAGYNVKLRFYRDCDGITAPLSMTLNYESASLGLFGSITLNNTSDTICTPICVGYLTTCHTPPGTYPGIEEWIYEGLLQLPAEADDWVLSTTECCRNNAITNIQNPGGDNIYVEALLNNTPAVGCNNSPQFATRPISFICENQYYCYSNGATDPDGDNLVFTLIDPMTGPPPATVLYNIGPPPLSGQQPFTPVGSTTFNNANGNICTTPGGQQVTVVAVKVEEYRNGILIGSVIRDIQVNVQPCTGNNIPELSGYDGNPINLVNTDTAFCPGEPITLNIVGSDPNLGDLLTMNLINPIPGTNFSVNGNGTANPIGTFTWNTTQNDTSSAPYCFTLQLSDDACPLFSQFTASYCIEITPNIAALQNMPDMCITDAPIQLNSGVPSGGTYSGNGVNNGVFDPSIAGTGTHTITYDYSNNLGCAGTATNTITVEQDPDPGTGISWTGCDNAAQIDLFSQLSGSPDLNGTWTDANGNVINNIYYPSSLISQTITYTVTGISCPNETAQIPITINQMPTAYAGPDTLICGDFTTLYPLTSIGDGAWSTNDNNLIIEDPNNPYSSVNTPDYGIYNLTWTENNNNCINSDDVTIEFIEPPFNLQVTPPLTYLCPNESQVLFVEGDFQTYQWYFNNNPIVGANSQIYNASIEGDYYVEVSNSICIATSPIATINIISSLDASILTFIDSIICPVDPPIQLEVVTPGGKWYGQGVNQNGLFTPSSVSVGQHWLTYVLDYNCLEQDSIMIELGCEVTLFVPNTFTPNNDEHNELFNIYGENIIDFELYIYSRWGELIFYSNDISNTWNGKMNDEYCQTGSYTYYIKIFGKDSQVLRRTGHINILR